MALTARSVIFTLAFTFLSSATFAQGDSLPSTGAEPMLPDPVPGTGADYPPSAATAGQGYVGPPLRKADPDLTCSPWNPCAYNSSTPGKPKGPGLAPPARLGAAMDQKQSHG